MYTYLQRISVCLQRNNNCRYAYASVSRRVCPLEYIWYCVIAEIKKALGCAKKAVVALPVIDQGAQCISKTNAFVMY